MTNPADDIDSGLCYRERMMRFRTWPLLCAGFGALLVLIAVSAALLNNRIDKVYSRVAAIQEINRETRDNLGGLRSELYFGAICVRDYILESSTATLVNERRILEELRHAPDDEFAQHLSEAKNLTEDTLKTVAVDVRMDGDPDRFPDSHRTCIYRVFQEALTNSARHSGASKIRVGLHGGVGFVSVIVEDNGVGFNPEKGRGRGLGLIGMEERVRELGGRVEIHSRPSRGTSLRCEISSSIELAP
jgi:signal transduction histidine kinase